MSKGKAPAAPDYAAAAKEQGKANVEAAMMGNPNVVSPYGTRTVSYSGGGFDDAGYNAAMSSWQSQMNALPGDEMGAFARMALSKNMPTREQFTSGQNIPTVTETLSPELQRIFSGAVSPFDPGSIPGIDKTAVNRNEVRDALVARQEQSIAQDRDNVRSDLIARGIPEGSEAFNREMDRLDRMTVDARQQAELGAGQAQQQALEGRRQLIQEALLSRQTPINELSALRSGAQLSAPQFGTPAAPDIMGATNAQYGAATDQANFRNAQAAQQQQAAASIISAFLLSDRRLKSNIVKVGEHPFGIGIYEYDIFGKRERGVMAQELLEVYPEAVVTLPSGYYAVNYDMIGGRP